MTAACLAGAAFLTTVFFTAACLAGAAFLTTACLAGAAFLTVVFLAAAVLLVAVLAEARAPAAVVLGSCFGSATTARNFVPALNFGTAVFLILTLAPVRGLRPILAARAARSKVPKPVIPTFLPLATSRMMTSSKPSTAADAAFLPPRRLSRASISCPLFTSSPPEEKFHRARPDEFGRPGHRPTYLRR